MKNISIVLVLAVVVGIIIYFTTAKKKVPPVSTDLGLDTVTPPNGVEPLGDTMDARPDGMTSPSSTVNDRLNAPTPVLSRPAASAANVGAVLSMQAGRGTSTPVSLTPGTVAEMNNTTPSAMPATAALPVNTGRM